jgi:5,10-methylenetetrahydromethanopterin reductase
MTMNNGKDYKLGIMFRREHAPEHLPRFAHRAEEAGFDELWLVEDCFYYGGVALAGTALAHTDTIAIGVGIMPAVVRNPVFTAMEIATLSRLYPERFLPGLGHGVAGWMRQIGALPRSQLGALEESTAAIRRLLAAEKLTYDGKFVKLDQAELVHPPDQVPPISLGVRGPKSLAISGRVADGTILAEITAPAYVSWAKEQIENAKLEAGHERDHRLTVFAFAAAGKTTDSARQELRPLLASTIASGKIDSHLGPMGILPQVREFLNHGGREHLEAAMPDTWIDELAVAGTPEDWELAINHLVEAGANTVVLVPLPGKTLEELDVFAEHFLS